MLAQLEIEREHEIKIRERLNVLVRISSSDRRGNGQRSTRADDVYEP